MLSSSSSSKSEKKSSSMLASSNHLYMAPQATIRTVRHQGDSTKTSSTGGGRVLLEDGSSTGIRSSNNTRRRRRGSSGMDPPLMDQLDNNSSHHHHNTKRGTAGTTATAPTPKRSDRSPVVMERQDSDNSLGAMAAVLVADRAEGASTHSGKGSLHHQSHLPHAPILWSDTNNSNHNNDTVRDNHHHHLHHQSPHMTKRKKPAVLSSSEPSELNAYRRSNHSPVSSKGKLKRGSLTGGSTHNKTNTRALHYGHEDFSENNLDESFNLSDDSPIPVDGLMTATVSSSINRVGSKRGSGWWKSLWWSIKLNFKEKASDEPSSPPASTITNRPRFFPIRWGQLTQITILVVLAIFVFNSHSKVQNHKDQLRQYDEERSHILDQMLWIDQAAKRVHKKYSEQEVLNSLIIDNNNNENGNPASEEEQKKQKALLEKAQQDLQTIQHKIQLNAREQLAATFGERPAEVSLQISKNGKLVIGLSDDTPHAISTLVQQVNRHLWDHIQVHVVGGASGGVVVPEAAVPSFPAIFELRSAPANALESNSLSDSSQDEGVGNGSNANSIVMPLLEFVERSHGCHEVGSVSMRQEEIEASDKLANSSKESLGTGKGEDETRLVLSVHLEPFDRSLPEGSVCIGRVLQGLDDVVNAHRRGSRDLLAEGGG